MLTEASTEEARVAPPRARRGGARARSTAAASSRWSATLDAFAAALRRENHTLKRALTDPRLFSGIGNAYSDEILHRARLSPVALTQQLADDEIERLLRGDRRPCSGVDRPARARRPATASPRRSPRSAPRWRCTAGTGSRARTCGSPVQRIVYAENETNYCARCQTGGRLLADRVAVAAPQGGLAADPRGAGGEPGRHPDPDAGPGLGRGCSQRAGPGCRRVAGGAIGRAGKRHASGVLRGARDRHGDAHRRLGRREDRRPGAEGRTVCGPSSPRWASASASARCWPSSASSRG